MRALVAFYSRTGTTKKVAEYMSKNLNCDIEEIIDTRNRSGALGYLSAGKDATFRQLTKLKEIKKDPKDYDLVIIGTPIWSWNISTPIRTYISQNSFEKVAFFCTMGGSGGERAFKEMGEMSKKPIAVVALTTKEATAGTYKEKARKFIKEIQHS